MLMTSKISMVLLLYVLIHFMLLPSQVFSNHCDVIWSELKDNVTRDLHDIEVGLKLLERENVVTMGRDFFLVPKIIDDFLTSGYRAAEIKLQNLVGHLPVVPGSNLKSSENIPEVVFDFLERSTTQAIQALDTMHQLVLCQGHTTNKTVQVSKSIQRRQRGHWGHRGQMKEWCILDGTKCMYMPCAFGKKLPICAIGFASTVTGGAAGPYYMVTRPGDDAKNPVPGTLRYAIEFARKSHSGAWIFFKKSMKIKLKDMLYIPSNTTIDGRGVKVTISGRCIAIAGVGNIILHNFEIVSPGQSDAIHVYRNARRIWIDHLVSSHALLGLVSVIQGSTDVTISNCYFSNVNYIMLLGASDSDTIDQQLRVTVYRNWFESSRQRMPHCRWGYCHVVNNYYRNWFYYAIGARSHAQVLSERNVFDARTRPEVTPWFREFSSDTSPTIQSSHDLLLKGATFHEFLKYGLLSSTPEDEYPMYNLPIMPTDSLADLVTNCSGVLYGPKVIRCLLTQ